MKKILLLLTIIILTSCTRIPVNSANQISWNGLTFPESDSWIFQSAAPTKLSLAGITIEIIDNSDTYTDFEKINIADQNYKLVSKTDPVILTTNWSGNDLLITGTNVNFETVSQLLSTFEISTMTWEGYEFKRPKTLDWYAEAETLTFVKDYGDNLEKEVSAPMKSEPQMTVSMTSDTSKLNTSATGEVKYYKEITFNESVYEVLRTVESEIEYVTYKGKISDSKFILIRAIKIYDGPAQNILNKVIGI